MMHTLNILATTQGAVSGVQDVSNNSAIQTSLLSGLTILQFDVNKYLGGDLNPGWGGSLTFKMKSNCDVTTNTILDAQVL